MHFLKSMLVASNLWDLVKKAYVNIHRLFALVNPDSDLSDPPALDFQEPESTCMWHQVAYHLLFM